MPGYPDVHPDDVLSLSAQASYVPRPSFEEAYANLSNNSPKDQARLAYEEFAAYYDKHPSKFPEDAEQDESDLS